MARATNHNRKRAARKMEAWRQRRDELILSRFRQWSSYVLRNLDEGVIVGVDYAEIEYRTVTMIYGERARERLAELQAAPREARDAVKRRQFAELYGVSGSASVRLSSGLPSFDNRPREPKEKT